MQVVLSGFGVRLLCFVQAKLYVGMVVFLGCTRMCRCDDVICVGHDLISCSGW